MDGEILGKTKLNITRRSLKKEATYHLMLLPGVLLTFVFCYIPIFGLTMAFQNFKPAFGLFGPQEWVGLNNLLLLFKQPDIYQILFNTIFISVMKGIFGIIVPVVVALMLNEIRECGVKKGIQTIIYLPHFISWVVIASMLVNVLSPGTGIVNIILSKLNLEEIFFLGDDKV
ncbi:MAG: sugar ABC transporter permease, partial [Clostridia bacterium]